MSKDICILGVNFAYHELAASFMRDGRLIAAAEEERFNRTKHGKQARIDNPDILPVQAINYCLRQAGVKLADVDHIGLSFYPEDRLKNIGVDKYYLENDWGGRTGEELFVKKIKGVPLLLNKLAGTDLERKIHCLPHHLCHAASGYFVSPYEKAAVLSIDGIGEFSSTWLGKGQANKLKEIKQIVYPNSIGFVWEKISKFLGLAEYDAAKVMGLAAFGDHQPFYKKFRKLIKTGKNGDYTVASDIWRFRVNDFQPLEKFLGVKRLARIEDRTEAHEDLAAALQKITDEVVLGLIEYLSQRTKSKNLCLAGGVALNCATNQKIMESGLFTNVYIQPAAHDAGTSLGAAYSIWCQFLGKPKDFIMDHAYWGPEFSPEEIKKVLDDNKLKIIRTDKIEEAAAKLLAQGNIIGWFQGRMEFGPRALGNRSLLADPRNPQMKDILNKRIKRREPFRPFAPSVLEEDANDWFVIPKNCQSLSSQFMEITFDVKNDKADLIPAVVHVDNTSRVQIVSKKANPKYHCLISEFKRVAGVPLVLNTSFNDNEPIVCTPQDAVNIFLRTRMDYLVIGDFLVSQTGFAGTSAM